MVGVCVGLGALAYFGIARDGVILWYLPLLPILACIVGGVIRIPTKGAAARLISGQLEARR